MTRFGAGQAGTALTFSLALSSVRCASSQRFSLYAISLSLLCSSNRSSCLNMVSCVDEASVGVPLGRAADTESFCARAASSACSSCNCLRSRASASVSVADEDAEVGEPARAICALVGDDGRASRETDVAAVAGRARTAEEERSVDLDDDVLTEGAADLLLIFAGA